MAYCQKIIMREIPELFLRNKGNIPYSFSFGQGGEPHCIIIGALHGNEDAGLQAIDKLYKEKAHIKNTITAVLGNPEAYKKDVRYIDENLNRIFRDQITGSSYESTRARELSELFYSIAGEGSKTVVIDIHTTSQGKEPLFMCHEDDNDTLQLLKKTPLFDTIVLITEHLPRSLCNLAQKYRFSYIGAECGKHKTSQAGNRAFEMIKKIGVRTDAVKESKTSPQSNKKIVRIEEMILPTQDLRFTLKEVRTVTPVKKGEVWAVDSDGERVAEKDMALFCIPKEVRHTDTNAGFICSYVN